jgi:S1-C subfamily serine protease
MTKKMLKILAFFLVGMAGGALANQILWPYFAEKYAINNYGSEGSGFVIEKREMVVQENEALTSAIEKASKAVVLIRSRNASSTLMEGSGLVVTSDGLIVTLAELVPQGSEFAFYMDNKSVSYRVLKRDLIRNLALVKIGASNLATVGFASDSLKLGERVFAIGEFLENKAFSQVVDEGIIRKISSSSAETDISGGKGLLGSPLFNIKSEAVGINFINGEGRIESIPISIIKEFAGL